ncbi:(2Fe-2S)-binding protein [Amycolatopsis sp. GM8]|uniref:(2Fe-2S)-binding protein n=1 Tax=Amycolatopsis sp. GM8 TaxID=2896530 RepID=UPI001F1EC09F|nr:(2Fe-2S)-binding protein [Amycolatopsis sp. GM8]
MTELPELPLTLVLNGKEVSATVDADATVVDVLREEFGVTGVRAGCRNGDCGTCTALVDGRSVKTCLQLPGRIHGADVQTLESIGTPDHPHPVQRAFLECYSFQCGFCLPGMTFAAITLLEHTPDPTDAQIRDALSGNLCRCTGYENFVRGVRRASRLMRETAG